MADMEATTVDEASVHTWISPFGTAEIITTGQGCQFEAPLFKALTKHARFPKGYHPKSNELIEW